MATSDDKWDAVLAVGGFKTEPIVSDDVYTRCDVFKGGPGLDGYIFNVDVYCADCAPQLPFGRGPFPWHVFNDSERVPQPVFFGESETEQHCAECGEYLYGGDPD